MNEDDATNQIIIGCDLISDGIACLREGIKTDMLTLKISEEDENRLFRIQDMADDLDRITRTYCADLADYKRHLKKP